MIIDCHGHVSAPPELWAYKSAVLSHRGSHGRGGVRVTDDQIRAAANKKEMAPCGHLDMLHKHGTDVQLISPRPFQMMSSFEPGRVVHWFVEECNKIIHRNVQLFPDKFIGICGLAKILTCAARSDRLKRCSRASILAIAARSRSPKTN